MFTKLEFEWDLNGMGPWNPTMVETSQYIKYLSELRYTLTVSLRNHKRETFFSPSEKNFWERVHYPFAWLPSKFTSVAPIGLLYTARFLVYSQENYLSPSTNTLHFFI